jgi:putative ABC transport system permease protein
MLWRIPSFALTAVLTLALGIGANTAIFSVVERVLLRPLPYKEPARLIQLWNTYPPLVPQGPNSAGDFRDFRQRPRTCSEMGAYVNTPRGLNLTGEGDPERLEMRYVTSGLFRTLGIKPIAGREFTTAEDKPGMPLTVLLSYSLWRDRFGSDIGVVGRRLMLDGRGYVVVGVLPEQMHLAPTTDIWVAMGNYEAGPDPYRYHEFNIIGRLKPGISIGQAQVEFAAFNKQQQRAFPQTHKNFGIQVSQLQDPSARRLRTALLILLGAVSLVLLVACANFANLLMARNAARQRELATRVALGASKGRLLSQLLTESVLLALMGGLGGVAMAEVGLRFLRVLSPAEMAGLNDAGLDFGVLAFTLALSLISGAVCGLIPGLQNARFDVHGMRIIGQSRGQFTRRVLVSLEIALAIILLVGAGLLMRSFQQLMDVDPGFRPRHIVAMEIEQPQLSPAEQSKQTNEEIVARQRQQAVEYESLMERIRAVPNVEAAGGISVLPLGTAMRSASRFLVEGDAVAADGARPVAETRNVSIGYFAAMGIPLRRGRLLDAHDYGSQNIVVNEALAERFWQHGDAIGKRINFCSLAPEPCWLNVVGVVGNVHQYGLDGAPTYDTYGVGGWQPYVVVRTKAEPRTVTQAIIREVHKFDGGLPVTHVEELERYVSDSVGTRRLSTFLLGLFAGLALLLAALGVYALMSYVVRLRTGEIGIRMALGAEPRHIWRLMAGSGARLVLSGIVIGLAGALALTKLLYALLYGVTATDPLTFGGAAVVLASVAAVACYFPTRRAMRIEPVTALR